jgi:hypothetical protein
MNANATPTATRAARRTGLALSALAVLFMLFSASFKLFATDAGLVSMQQLGIPKELMFGFGILEMSCALLFALPRTAFLGAVLLSGYLGGAVMTHLRVLDPWGSHVLFPTYVGAVAWAGLALRDPRVRALFLGRA